MSRKLKLALQNVSTANQLPSKAELKRWAEAALQTSVQQADITIRIVDTAEGQQLNREYRGKDYATNVLTFTFDDDLAAIPNLPLLGDLVLCAPVIEREAQEQGKPLLAHYGHLVIHGMLHLQGFDHIEQGQAESMEALETRLLASLGIADPYA